MIPCPVCGEVPRRLLIQDDDRTRDLVCRCGTSRLRHLTHREDELWLFGSSVRWLVYDSHELQEWMSPSGFGDVALDEEGLVPPHLAGEALSRVVCSLVLES